VSTGTLYTLCIRHWRLSVFVFLALVRYGLAVQFFREPRCYTLIFGQFGKTIFFSSSF
jgi:hypothetical protein